MSLPVCPQGLFGAAASGEDVTRLNCDGQFKPFIYLNGSARAGSRSAAPVRPAQPDYSPSNGASRLDIQCVERMRACHEQAVLFGTAEGEIGTALRKVDEADGLSFRVEYFHAVQFLALGVWRTTVPKTAPKVAVGIDPHSVESSRPVGIDEFGLV